MDKTQSILIAAVAALIGAAVGYHLWPRIIMATGGSGDEAAILARLDGCEGKLSQISQQLRHEQQLADLYRELYERSKHG